MFAGTRLLMNNPEVDLVAHCRSGDLDAFGQLYAEHEEPIFRHALHLLGSRDDAWDACQETFVKAFQAIKTFRGDCAVRLWLLRICTNQCRNQLRARSRRRESSLDLEEPLEDLTELLDQRHLALLLQAALDRLAPAHREVIVLRDLEGLSAAETAAVLGCSVVSVPVRLFRARRRLKELVRTLTPEME